MKPISLYSLVLFTLCLSSPSSRANTVLVEMPLAGWDRPVIGWQWNPDAGDWSYLGQSGTGAGWAFTVPEGQWTWSGLTSSSYESWLQGCWVMVLPTVSQQVEPLGVALLAHYPLDGDASERLANGANGTLANVTPGSDRFNREGKALTFSGTGSVTIPYDEDAAFGGEDFTVALWFRVDPAANSLGSTLVNLMGVPSGGLNMLNFWFATGDAAPVNYSVGVEVWRRGKNAFIINDYPLNDGAWHHLTVVRRGREVWSYLNADLAGMNEIIALTDPIALRGAIKLGTNGFNGQMDDLRIYKRALGEEEIKLLVNASAD